MTPVSWTRAVRGCSHRSVLVHTIRLLPLEFMPATALPGRPSPIFVRRGVLFPSSWEYLSHAGAPLSSVHLPYNQCHSPTRVVKAFLCLIDS
jgi:hypothetical protein